MLFPSEGERKVLFSCQQIILKAQVSFLSISTCHGPHTDAPISASSNNQLICVNLRVRVYLGLNATFLEKE